MPDRAPEIASVELLRLREPLKSWDSGARDGLVSKLRTPPPLLPQLPTDALGPAGAHRRARIANASVATLPAEVVAHLEALPGGFEVACAVATAASLGCYARASQLALCVQQDDRGWAPLRVDLLLPEAERTGGAEDSAVTPAGDFARTCDVAHAIAEDLRTDGEDDNRLYSSHELAILDGHLADTPADPQDALFQALEVGLCINCKQLASAPRRHPLTFALRRQRAKGKVGRAAGIELHYACGVLSEATAQRMLRHFVALLAQLPTRWDKPLCELEFFITDKSLLAQYPQSVQLSIANRTEAEDVQRWCDACSTSCYCRPTSPLVAWQADRSVIGMFDQQVETNPHAVALIEDGTGAWWTYSQLSQTVDSLADALVGAGVHSDVLVPVLAPRCAAMVIGILGILRAGGAYVPVDLHWPDSRVLDVLAQCGAKVLLGCQAVHQRMLDLQSGAVVFIVEDIVSGSTRGPNADTPLADKRGRPPRGQDLVYVFFTSGTTGQPKGVMVEHRGLAHRVHWFQQRWPLQPGEAVMQKVAYTFGLSEWEIFWPLTAGAALVLAPPGGERDPDYLLRRACGAFEPPPPPPRSPAKGALLAEGASRPPLVRVAAHVFVPSALQMVLERMGELEEQEMACAAGVDLPGGTWWRSWPARQVVTCGEPLSAPLAHRAFSRLPEIGVANLYGPTEGEMTVWDVPRGGALSRISAGSPMAGSKAVLVALRDRRAAAALEPAEIAFGGPFIARGYLGRPDLDQKAFVPDFTDFTCAEEGRLYLTGDLGRWREGQVELLGRRDFQVKLRGFRIELGEVEAAVRSAGARAAVCVLRPGAGGAPALVAYYEPGADGQASEAAVRAACGRLLPRYMQPQSVVQLSKLPRNGNGKVDRAKLPAPSPASGTMADGEAPVAFPESPTEKAIAEIWAEVLGTDVRRIPADADFPELGGTSLLVGRATGLMRSRLRAPGLAGTAMYQHSTIRRLAPVVWAAREQAATVEASVMEGVACRMEVRPPACQPMSAGLSSTRPWALFVQLGGIFLLSIAVDSVGLSPLLWGMYFIHARYGVAAMVAYFPLGAILDLLVQLLMCIMLKWVVVGRLQPGRYPLWSTTYFKWWFGNVLMGHMTESVLPMIAETALMNACLRLCGAKVGKGSRVSVLHIADPDLVIMGEGVTVGKFAMLSCSAVLHGHLHLGIVRLGNGSALGPRATLSQGADVPAGRAVLPMSTAPGWHGAVGAVQVQDALIDGGCVGFRERQDVLRAVFGVPLVVVLTSAPSMAAWFLCLQLLLAAQESLGPNAFFVYSMSLVWVYGSCAVISFVAMVILVKRLIVGRLRPGTCRSNHWAEFRHWVHARLVESRDFHDVCHLLVNTELLSWIYRRLGAKIGRRVQIDNFHLVEHDCLDVRDYAVFGSEIVVCCDSRAPWTPAAAAAAAAVPRGRPLGLETVQLCQGANALDHCVFLPGSVVDERAVLGSCSLAHHRSYFPPLSISSGSLRGRAVHLRNHNATKALQMLEDKAMQALDSPVVWWRFNAFLITLALLVKPIAEAMWVLAFFAVGAVWDLEKCGLAVFVVSVPIIHFVLGVLELVGQVGFKWLIMGRFRAGDHPFFGDYHCRWMALMLIGHSAQAMTEILQGTAFNAWFYRANGARVGRNCYLAGLVVECDLLDIGDNVAIGHKCDTTCHTVENMVIKLAPTHIEQGACLLPGSFAMPGTVLEEEAVLLEHSQVLKGETVPRGEVWAGMPAARCCPQSAAA